MDDQTLPRDLQPERQASLIEAARAARQRAATTRADVLGLRLAVHRQRLRRDRILETGTIAIHQARQARTNSRSSRHFGLDWQEPDESLDTILLVPEP